MTNKAIAENSGVEDILTQAGKGKPPTPRKIRAGLGYHQYVQHSHTQNSIYNQDVPLELRRKAQQEADAALSSAELDALNRNHTQDHYFD